MVDFGSMPPIQRLLARLDDAPGVLGAILVGSSSRSYRDEMSDLDIEVIVSDRASSELEQALVVSGDGDLDILVLPLSDLRAKVASPSDVDHWPYERCAILRDSDGTLARIVERIRVLPESVRADRLRLHYFEFLFALRHLERCSARGDELNARMTTATGLRALVRLLSVLSRRYPPLAHWTSQNLTGTSFRGVERLMVELSRNPRTRSAEHLIQVVDDLLTEAGEDFHYTKGDLTQEVAGPSFRPARERYGMI